MKADLAALLAVLAETRAYLARSENDFSWSSFSDPAAALAEFDAATAMVRAGSPVPSTLAVLFAPTGPVQEVSLSSGWGTEFLVLAGRFDAAVAGAKPGRPVRPVRRAATARTSRC